MGRKPYFAVKVGRKPGVYSCWEDCKTQIIGMSTAKWRRFTSYEEATSYCFPSSKKSYGKSTAISSSNKPINVDDVSSNSGMKNSKEKGLGDQKTIEETLRHLVEKRIGGGLSSALSSSTPCSSPNVKSTSSSSSIGIKSEISLIIEEAKAKSKEFAPTTDNYKVLDMEISDITLPLVDFSESDTSTVVIESTNEGSEKRKKLSKPRTKGALHVSESDDEIEIIENPRKDVQMNQSISEQFHRIGKTEEEVAVGIFWDIENVRMPRGFNPAKFITKIREKFVDESSKYCEKHFYVVCDTNDWPSILMKQLFEFHVRIIHVPRLKANSSDNVIRDLMHEFVNYNKFARLILISGDSDFSHDIHNFRRNRKFDCILIHNKQTKDSMVRSATSAYLYTELIRQELLEHNTQNNRRAQDSFRHRPGYQYSTNRRRSSLKRKRSSERDLRNREGAKKVPYKDGSSSSSGLLITLPNVVASPLSLSRAYYRKKRKEMITPKKTNSRSVFMKNIISKDNSLTNYDISFSNF